MCNYRPDWGWRVFPLAPIVWWTQLGYRLSLSLCWTFKLSAVKQINLFLPAHVFLIFLLTSVFLSSIWPCLLFSSVSVDYPLSCPPLRLLFPLPSLLLYEGQVQGSPITQRGLRKLYGFCPRGCHVALSSGRLQVCSSHWLPAQQPQPQAQHWPYRLS